MNILRVFRLETWLTVYRALSIPKHSGGAKGCSGQRLSMPWTKQIDKMFQTVSSISKRSDQVQEYLRMRRIARVILKKYEEIDDL